MADKKCSTLASVFGRCDKESNKPPKSVAAVPTPDQCTALKDHIDKTNTIPSGKLKTAMDCGLM